jgi:hypothetical protein
MDKARVYSIISRALDNVKPILADLIVDLTLAATESSSNVWNTTDDFEHVNTKPDPIYDPHFNENADCVINIPSDQDKINAIDLMEEENEDYYDEWARTIAQKLTVIKKQ